jgi:hypothetical protein
VQFFGLEPLPFFHRFFAHQDSFLACRLTLAICEISEKPKIKTAKAARDFRKFSRIPEEIASLFVFATRHNSGDLG